MNSERLLTQPPGNLFRFAFSVLLRQKWFCKMSSEMIWYYEKDETHHSQQIKHWVTEKSCVSLWDFLFCYIFRTNKKERKINASKLKDV